MMTTGQAAPRRARRRWAITACVALLLLTALAWGLWQIARARCFALIGQAICHVETGRPLVALTFDDGPTDRGVDAILPVLAAHGARATFFLIGNELAQRPALARRILAAGNEIGNHSYSHVRMVGHGEAFYAREIARTDALIRAVGGRPGLFRPPNGKKLIGLPRALASAQRRMIMWDVEDPHTDDPAAFARQIVTQARPGSIILVHAMYRTNRTGRQALPLILDGLAARGLKVVTVSDLLAAGSPPKD